MRSHGYFSFFEYFVQDIAVGVAKLKEQMANPMRLGAKGSKKNPLNMGVRPRCGPFQ